MKVDLVVGGCLIHDNKVLLIHHKKSDKWLPPGGHIERGETPDEAVEREFMEELNLQVKILNRNDIPNEGNITEQLAVPFYVNVHNVGDHEHACFFYLCRPKNPGALKLNKEELNDFKWFSLEELKQNHIQPDVRNIAKKAFEAYNRLKK
ncbi:MAG: NUDIX domain-containing protein [Candidatus Aenigmarchaeota archaeon]|nr:NUDIX domain-containing protein [Candidatus Aenigmarchaeota archaeon]NIP40984.1 NUDIX domain-containing protein [Candidatus Aenigmarchaeota archaeon]NIQ18589.1 NUDIX domain-containing protein [Candidatus Aenigmarchaeota archaeon]